jgi:hypothetical protein
MVSYYQNRQDTFSNTDRKKEGEKTQGISTDRKSFKRPGECRDPGISGGLEVKQTTQSEALAA